MSYEIVRGIKNEDNNVFVKCSSNNVIPKTYKWHKSEYFTRILKEKGLNALNIDILKAYESGNFQEGTQNKYTRALKVLRNMKEYQSFDWRTMEDNKDKRTSKEFELLLEKALNTKLPKQKYIIIKDYFGRQVYFYQRRNSSFCNWKGDMSSAKRFDYKREAENTILNFQNSENWKTIPLNN